MTLAVLVLTGLLGLVLIAFGLPGGWLFLVVAAVLKIAGVAGPLSWTALIAGLGLALVAEVVEWLVSMRWTVRYGGSTRAAWGALAGGLIGAVIGLPVPLLGSLVGSFFGAFLGALAAEYTVTRGHAQAGRAAWGALVGRVVSTAFKMALTVVIVVVVLGSAWR